ncbi:MAG TPA: alpha/beta hydrolase, partial [Anaerolineaceae bacterium]|nr:alpha/beta hydrolase [Anaerolineaceae bacterium]
SVEHTFSPRTVRRYRPFRRLLEAFFRRQARPERLPRILRELLDLDQRALLGQIRCPALVIGGEDDQVIPAAIQHEMAALIPGSELILYPGYGHGNDQENPDYPRQVDRFVRAISGR